MTLYGEIRGYQLYGEGIDAPAPVPAYGEGYQVYRGVRDPAVRVPAYGAVSPSSTSASTAPPVGPSVQGPPGHRALPPSRGSGRPLPGTDYNHLPGDYGVPLPPSGPRPMPGGDNGGAMGYGGPGGERDGFRGNEGFPGSAPRSQSHGGSVPSGSQPPSNGVGASAAPVPADVAVSSPLTGASAAPPVSPSVQNPPGRRMTPPPGGYSRPHVVGYYNCPPGGYGGPVLPSGPSPGGGRGGFLGNNATQTNRASQGPTPAGMNRAYGPFNAADLMSRALGPFNAGNGSANIIPVMQQSQAVAVAIPHGLLASVPQSQFYYGSHGGSAATGSGRQPPSNDVGSAATAPPVGPYVQAPIGYRMAPPPCAFGEPLPIWWTNHQPGVYSGEVPPSDPRPIPGSDNGGPMDGGVRGEFQGNNDEEESSRKRKILENEDVDLLRKKVQGMKVAMQDLGKLLASGENSDVTVQVGDVEIRVHRFILSARSPVLSAMFGHDTAERASNKIVIEDCEPEVFKEFLHYLYTGSVRSLAELNVFSLYRVADKYLADNLKQQCLAYIQSTLSVQTFISAVQLAFTHGESGLLDEAVTFAAENIQSIVCTVEWQNFLREYPTEANEVLIKSLCPQIDQNNEME